MIRTIDIDGWERAGPFRFFSTYQRPQYGLVARIDITRMMTERKAAGHRPFIMMLHAMSVAGNAVPAFRQRLRGGTGGEPLSVIEYDRIGLGPTVARPDGSFAFASIPHADCFASFEEEAARRIVEAIGTTGLEDKATDDGSLYLSCTPTIDFTALTNAMRGPLDSVPRICWGKFVEAPDGRWSCALSVEVHHCLIDGAHIAAFFAAAQQTLDSQNP